MNILGTSDFYNDSSACILQDGENLSSAQEERFTRKKHDPDFPGREGEACEKRDPKVLCEKVRAGLVTEFFGADLTYEAPKAPALGLNITEMSADLSVEEIYS